jgi:hypothetical protein
MLSISKPITNAADAAEYYAGGNTGRWFGAGAQALQMQSLVNTEPFRSLLNGFSPNAD